MTILIVEDEAATRRGLISVIKKMDRDSYVLVGEADNGAGGMRMIYDLKPDVVITDICMPRVNGLDMIQNACESSPDTSYIILSGYADFQYAQKAIHLPVVEYLLKPITRQQLQATLDELNDRLQEKRQRFSEKRGEEEQACVDFHSEVVSRLVETIRKDYAQRLYLENFARRMRLTPEYLGAMFARETGKSFSSFLRDVRMEHARELLLNSDCKIYEIAFKVGYPDPKYFCKIFKEYTGVSAKSYARKNCGAEVTARN